MDVGRTEQSSRVSDKSVDDGLSRAECRIGGLSTEDLGETLDGGDEICRVHDICASDEVSSDDVVESIATAAVEETCVSCMG